ncbi:MAG: penicillin acylase family protein [Saprospiraceae bacterium]
MKFLKFIISLALCASLCIALSTQFVSKGQYLPAFGDLMNPFSGFWQNAEFLMSTNNTDVKIAGLKGKVSVTYDDRAVPHIFAENTVDAIKVQGYLHAQNRLFQMDISARSAAGRLSEIFGVRTMEYDMTERRYGMGSAAERTVEGWKKNPEVNEMIQAYADGVNAYIQTLTDRSMPVEYKILGFRPEKWTPLHSALFTKSMCKTLARNDLDAEMSNTLSKLGPAEFSKLFPERHPKQTPIVPNGTKWNFAALQENLSAPTNPTGLSFIDKTDNSDKEPGIGSNNWVIAGSKTENGHPILCGDPHLNLTLPSIWYEIQISTPQFNTYGVSLPGMPMILIGFNSNIAWTVTNSQYDVADWYRMEWLDSSKKTYRFDGNIMSTHTRIEEIIVKGKGVVKDTVTYTHLGPIVFTDKTKVQSDLAFHWVAAEENPYDLTSLYLLAQAKNFSEFNNALKTYSFPMQNFAFASKDGDIAIRTQGWLPIKAPGTGQFVQEGNTSANQWKGFVPAEQMPVVKNPKSGFVASANQNTTDAAYPYYYNSRNFDNFRARRINALLSAEKKFSMDDMRNMQYDCYGLDAFEYIPVILEHLNPTNLSVKEKAIYDGILNWDCVYEKTSVPAMYFRAWMDQMKKMTWDDLYLREKNNPFVLPHLWRTIQLVHDEPNSIHFDKTDSPQVENASDILLMSLQAGIADVEKEMATRMDPAMDYGKFIDTRIDHIARIPGFGEKIYTSGNENAVNATRGNKGPSWRMVVEMGDEPRAYIVYPGGETGNPGNPKYNQFVKRWESGEHYEAIYMKSASESNERLKKTIQFSSL